MSAGEATLALRELLAVYGVAADRVQRLSSHSLKTTVLSWAAKAGLSIEHRRLLGHHTAPGDLSALNYSRDALSKPLEEVCRMIDSIAAGSFQPDLPRSARLLESRPAGEADVPEAQAAQAASEPDFLLVDEGDLEASQTSSEGEGHGLGSAESADSDGQVPDVAGDHAVLQALRPDLLRGHGRMDGAALWQHATSGIVHAAAEGDRARCGRVLGPFHAPIAAELSGPWPICRVCQTASRSAQGSTGPGPPRPEHSSPPAEGDKPRPKRHRLGRSASRLGHLKKCLRQPGRASRQPAGEPGCEGEQLRRPEPLEKAAAGGAGRRA